VILGLALAAMPCRAEEDPWGEAGHKIDLGDGFLQDGRISRALEFYEWALRLAPDWWKPHHRVGEALRRAGSPLDVVLGHFRRALEASPGVFVVWWSMGQACEAAGDWEGAERGYREALAVSGPTAVLLVRLAAALLEQRRWEEARQVLGEAVRFNPGPAAFHHLARLAREDGNVAEEEGCLRVLLRRAPDPAPYASRLGILLQQTGRPEAAERLARWLSGDRRTPPPER